MSYQFHLTLADCFSLLAGIAFVSIYGYLLAWRWYARKQEAKHTKQ